MPAKKTDKPQDERALGDLLAELEETVRWFEEQESADLEEGLVRVRRGAELVKELRTRLRQVENEFEEVTSQLEDAS